ncbi:MAG TPA: hypothetical protein GXX29_10570 [Firmicutes bacterium]|nr:hypothetical protein [Bacillota bacterium]
MSTRPDKLLVLGIDAALPDLLQKFSDEGILPNITGLMGNGIFSRVIPTFPPLTAAAWAAITTGAGPGTAGIPSLMVHLPGEDLDQWHTSFDRRLLQAQTLWEAGGSVGKRTALINWPVIWPMSNNEVTQVAAALNPPFRFFYMPLWDIASSSFFSTKPRACNQIPGRAVVVRPEPVLAGWGPPGSGTGADSRRPPLTFTMKIPPTYVPGHEYKVFIIDSCGRGYDQVLISRNREGREVAVRLSVGETSAWLVETFTTPEGKRRGRFRFQLIKLSPDGTELDLYVSAINTAETYTNPPSLTAAIEATAGPYMEVDDPWAFMDGWLPFSFYMEQLAAHNDWWVKATSYILKTQEWDMAFSWVGTIDHLQHVVYGGIEPRSRMYDAEGASYWLDALRQVYHHVDQGIGEILQQVDLERTLVVVVSDHGFTHLDQFLFLKKALADAGLLAYTLDERTGEMHIDWLRTKCHPLEPCHAHIFINLKGRDPHGAVPPEDYGLVQQEIITALLNIRDPDTGERVVTAALTKEEALTLGVYQGRGFDRVGDVLFALKPGYMANPYIYRAVVKYRDHTERFMPNPELFERSALTRNFTGAHLTLPTIAEMHAALIVAGPGVPCTRRRHPLQIIDIAPTLAYLLGIPCPKDAEGNIVWDMVAELCSPA